MEVTAIGIEEAGGAVSYRYAGIADELLPHGESLSGTIRALEMARPDEAGGRSLVHAGYARERIVVASDIVEYVRAVGMNQRCRFALLMCGDGWVGWSPQVEPRRAAHAQVVERIEAVANDFETAMDSLEPAGRGMSAAATQALALLCSTGGIAQAIKDIRAIDERESMDVWYFWRRLEDAARALLQACASASPRARQRQLESALENLLSGLDAARDELARRTARSLWLPGSEIWPERGSEIVVALERVAEAVAASREETSTAQELLSASRRIPPRRAKGYRDGAREHARLAGARARAATEHLNAIASIETDLGQALLNLEHSNAEIADRRVFTVMMRNVVSALTTAERLFGDVAIARRSAGVAFRATTEYNVRNCGAAAPGASAGRPG